MYYYVWNSRVGCSYLVSKKSFFDNTGDLLDNIKPFMLSCISSQSSYTSLGRFVSIQRRQLSAGGRLNWCSAVSRRTNMRILFRMLLLEGRIIGTIFTLIRNVRVLLRPSPPRLLCRTAALVFWYERFQPGKAGSIIIGAFLLPPSWSNITISSFSQEGIVPGLGLLDELILIVLCMMDDARSMKKRGMLETYYLNQSWHHKRS